jgi:hypothetical protein
LVQTVVWPRVAQLAITVALTAKAALADPASADVVAATSPSRASVSERSAERLAGSVRRFKRVLPPIRQYRRQSSRAQAGCHGNTRQEANYGLPRSGNHRGELHGGDRAGARRDAGVEAGTMRCCRESYGDRLIVLAPQPAASRAAPGLTETGNRGPRSRSASSSNAGSCSRSGAVWRLGSCFPLPREALARSPVGPLPPWRVPPSPSGRGPQ